jgi:hypothetical protein
METGSSFTELEAPCNAEANLHMLQMKEQKNTLMGECQITVLLFLLFICCERREHVMEFDRGSHYVFYR